LQLRLLGVLKIIAQEGDTFRDWALVDLCHRRGKTASKAASPSSALLQKSEAPGKSG